MLPACLHLSSCLEHLPQCHLPAHPLITSTRVYVSLSPSLMTAAS